MVKESNAPMMNRFMPGQNTTCFSRSKFCLWSWCHLHNDKALFQRLSALIWFQSVSLLRIEKRFETRGVELGFVSFYSNPACGLKSLSLSQELLCFRDFREDTRAWGLGNQPTEVTPIPLGTAVMSRKHPSGVFGGVGHAYWETRGDGYLETMQKVVFWQMKICVADPGH